MGDHILQTLLLSKAVDLEQALEVMLEADAKQQKLRAQHADIYDASFHAAGIAQHIQGIYTQIESLLKQAIEQTDGCRRARPGTRTSFVSRARQRMTGPHSLTPPVPGV